MGWGEIGLEGGGWGTEGVELGKRWGEMEMREGNRSREGRGSGPGCLVGSRALGGLREEWGRAGGSIWEKSRVGSREAEVHCRGLGGWEEGIGVEYWGRVGVVLLRAGDEKGLEEEFAGFGGGFVGVRDGGKMG